MPRGAVFVLAANNLEPRLGLAFNYDWGASGRSYVQSDPIGLLAGVNTYAYVEDSPLRWVDKLGLALGDPPPLDKIGRGLRNLFKDKKYCKKDDQSCGDYGDQILGECMRITGGNTVCKEIANNLAIQCQLDEDSVSCPKKSSCNGFFPLAMN